MKRRRRKKRGEEEKEEGKEGGRREGREKSEGGEGGGETRRIVDMMVVVLTPLGEPDMPYLPDDFFRFFRSAEHRHTVGVASPPASPHSMRVWE